MINMNGTGMSMASTRRFHAVDNGAKSALGQHYNGDMVQINGKWAHPMAEHHKLYAKAFKAVVDDASSEGLVRVIMEQTPSHTLLIRARNMQTGNEIRLHGRYFNGIGEYVAAVETIGSSESKFQNRLTGSNTDQLMSQYRDLRRRLYNHLK
jgi:hypothetical protein